MRVSDKQKNDNIATLTSRDDLAHFNGKSMLDWGTATTVSEPRRVVFTIRSHTLIADRGGEDGGHNAGPTPQELLLASLGSCTAISLQKCAQEAGWPAIEVEVDVRFSERAGIPYIERIVSIASQLSGDQRDRLLVAAEETPITRLLRSNIRVQTELA